MGAFDFIDRWTDSVVHEVVPAVDNMIQDSQRLAEDVERRIRDGYAEYEQAIQHAENMVNAEAEKWRSKLDALRPADVGERAAQLLDDVVDIVAAAAAAGTVSPDLTDAVAAAIRIAFARAQQKVDKAHEAVNQELDNAETALNRIIDGVVPDAFRILLDPVKDLIHTAIVTLKAIGDAVRRGLGLVLDGLNAVVRQFVGVVCSLAGPVWRLIKEVRKLLFGEEPKQCELARQWFEERMKRIEKQFL
jgi:hypothetical protein